LLAMLGNETPAGGARGFTAGVGGGGNRLRIMSQAAPVKRLLLLFPGCLIL